MKIEVVDIINNDDGSCNLILDMSEEALHKFASIGILKAITAAAQEVIDNVDNFIETVEEHKNEHYNLKVAGYIDDAIKLLERRPQGNINQAAMIDALVETCQDAINILIVAKGMLNATKT